MSEPKHIVLVHGAWGQAACWGRVPALLRQEGFEVWTPHLPGHAPGDTPDPSVTLDSYAEALLRTVNRLPNPVVVGHSMGGMAISALGQRAPEKVSRLIYLAAFLPRDGDSLVSLKAREQDTIGPAILPGPIKGTTVLDPVQAGQFLCQDATEQQQEELAKLLRPQTNAPQTKTLRITANGLEAVPKSYIMCMDDRTITPDLQLTMANESHVRDILSLQTGHYPQLSAPQRLTDLITAVCHRHHG